MIDSFAQLFPTWYNLPPRERVYQQQIILNWLDMEVEPDAPRRMPILNELRSWRNREVYYFIADGWDWTKSLFETGQYFRTKCRRTDGPSNILRPSGQSVSLFLNRARRRGHVAPLSLDKLAFTRNAFMRRCQGAVPRRPG